MQPVRFILFGLLLATLVLSSCTHVPGGSVHPQPAPGIGRDAPGGSPEGGVASGKKAPGAPRTMIEPQPLPAPPPPQAPLPTETGKAPATGSDGTVAKTDRKPLSKPTPVPPLWHREAPETEGLKEYTIESDDLGNTASGERLRRSNGNGQKTIDEALALLNQSQALWEKGELDRALALLDQANALTFELRDDSEIAWQRDDLRFLIAKRIIEIYASRSTVAVGLQSEIPLSTAEEVEFEIRRFQNEERAFFLRSYQRSGAYRPMIVEQLKQAGLPEELSWLPLVESGFIVKAFSSARALGLWQFIPSTGYKFGLKRDQFVDERMDPERSTRAAIAYLTELHGIFADWLTVLAAYNCGEGRVLKVISGQRLNYLDNFWDLYRQLPNETRRYVPRFLATLRILKDPAKYGFDLEKEPLDAPIPFETVPIERSMRLADIARALEIDEELLSLLNAELRLKVTPKGSYRLKVPAGKAEGLLAAIESIPGAPRAVTQLQTLVRHKVRSGESLSTIAARYGSSVEAIARTNRLSKKNLIRAGQTLLVPSAGGGPRTAEASVPQQHKVQRGESLSAIAARYGMSVEALARANQISHKHFIREGQVLTLRTVAAQTEETAPKETVSIYRVKTGDSLFTLARRFDTTVTQLKELNRLNSNLITVGQELRIPGKGPSAGQEGKGEAVRYVVQAGDSPHKIAMKFNASVEKILKLNDLSQNDVIHPGQTLIIQE